MDSSSQPPKLALFSSFPNKGKEPPPPPLGMPTSPVHKVASVPFQWEEAPGKPRPGCTDSKPSSTVARSLDLPPRLVFIDHHVKLNNNNNNNNNNHGSSPTTVLEGPYVSRSFSYTLSFRKGGRDKESHSRVLFGSTRWVSSSATPSRVKKNDDKVNVGGSFDFFSSIDDIGSRGGGGGGGGTKVKMTRVRKRSGSFRSLSHSSSHLWTSICESFKQVVPWKRSSRQEKLR